MSLLWLAALLAAQAADPEMFGEADGWSIARHDDFCLMTREFGGEGNTIVTFALTPDDEEAPLTILVGNSGWPLPEADDDGYLLEFAGNGALWTDLAVRTFTTDDDGDGARDGVISIDFAADAVTPILEDLAGATGLRLSRQGALIDEVRFGGSAGAIGSFGQCLGTLR